MPSKSRGAAPGTALFGEVQRHAVVEHRLDVAHRAQALAAVHAAEARAACTPPNGRSCAMYVMPPKSLIAAMPATIALARCAAPRARSFENTDERQPVRGGVRDARWPRPRPATRHSSITGPNVSSRMMSHVGRDVGEHGRREVLRPARRARAARRRARARPASTASSTSRSTSSSCSGVTIAPTSTRSRRRAAGPGAAPRRASPHARGERVVHARRTRACARRATQFWPAVDEAAGERGVGRLLEVGVVAHDHRVLAAELEDHRRERLARPRRARAGRCATEPVKTTLSTPACDQRRAGLAVALDELHEIGRLALGASASSNDALRRARPTRRPTRLTLITTALPAMSAGMIGPSMFCSG